MMFTIHFIECHLAITQQRSRETLLNNNQQRQNEREEKKPDTKTEACNAVKAGCH